MSYFTLQKLIWKSNTTFSLVQLLKIHLLDFLFLREHNGNRVKRKAQLCFFAAADAIKQNDVGRRGVENRSCKISPRQFI